VTGTGTAFKAKCRIIDGYFDNDPVSRRIQTLIVEPVVEPMLLIQQKQLVSLLTLFVRASASRRTAGTCCHPHDQHERTTCSWRLGTAYMAPSWT
jgi:hypothetical protein